jgi:hypothetical protein
MMARLCFLIASLLLTVIEPCFATDFQTYNSDSRIVNQDVVNQNLQSFNVTKYTVCETWAFSAIVLIEQVSLGFYGHRSSWFI